MSDTKARTAEQIEADIASTRQHLADTVDQLSQAAQPQAIARRQVEGAKASFARATRTETGELRVERGRHFVEQHELRLHRERARNGHALLLAT